MHLPYISAISPLYLDLRGERRDGGHAADGETKEDLVGAGTGAGAGGRDRDRGWDQGWDLV